MSKTYLVALLAVTGAVLWTDNAEARSRRGCRNHTIYQTARTPWVTTTTAPTPAAVINQSGGAVTQPNTATTYQSYSYEPAQTYDGAPATSAINSVVMSRAPGAVRRNAFEYNNVLRGDRKVRGHTAEGE